MNTAPELKINREIRALKVRVIGAEGEQLGIMSSRDAYMKAQEEGLDLVEIAPNAEPPVCKIIDYGKYRYDQTKKEKENKKAQHQIKVKEIKLKPNIDEHDFQTKLRNARAFLEKGNKVKISCMFRGRELAHKEIGEKVVERFVQELDEVGAAEAPMKLFGKTLNMVMAPAKKK